MFLGVTLAAVQFQVREVRQDLRVLDVVRIDVGLMVHDLAGIIQALLQAALTESARLPVIIFPALLPGRRFIELVCRFCCHIQKYARRL